MSEIKGSLLTIVLCVAVFGLVFGLIMTAIKSNTSTITDRMKDAAEQEPTAAVLASKDVAKSSVTYHF